MTDPLADAIQALVNEQAEDEGLWFIAETAAEAYLQQELRRLHALIERAPGDPEPIANETASGYARRQELVREAREAERASVLVPTRLLRTEWPPNDGVLPGDPYFDGLLADIRANGIREPLNIRLDWSVIDGCHRLSAAKVLGIETIPVRIWTGSDWVPSAPARTLSEPASKERNPT